MCAASGAVVNLVKLPPYRRHRQMVLTRAATRAAFPLRSIATVIISQKPPYRATKTQQSGHRSKATCTRKALNPPRSNPCPSAADGLPAPRFNGAADILEVSHHPVVEEDRIWPKIQHQVIGLRRRAPRQSSRLRPEKSAGATAVELTPLRAFPTAPRRHPDDDLRQRVGRPG